MGLPLWREPDNSNTSSRVPSRSPADPATGRSSIRRPTSPRISADSTRRRRLREVREQRLRTLIAAQPNDDNNPPLSVRLTLPPGAESRAADDFMRADPEPRSIDRFMVSFTGHPEDPALSSEIAAIVGIRAHPPDFYSDVPHLEAGDDDTLGQTARGDHADHLIQAIRAIRHRQREVRSMHDADQDLTRDLALFERPESRRADTGARSNTVRNEPEDGRHTLSETPPYRASIRLRPPPSPPSPLHVPESPALDFERDLREYRRQAARLANNRRLRLGSHRSIRLVDGLGDRDRSLSPEGDGVWDTLQSTLTPDPQPPSVGSSFASTTASTAASTAASQNPTVPSSRTSITSPGEDVEPPCDPVNEPEGFLEGGEDVEAPEPDRPRRSNPHGRLSYAEAALSGSGSPTGDPEWLPGMHHIIRRLAARQDIPDEWWQQAGLSRSMSWESSN